MIFDPKIFYLTYQKDYHETKATYLNKVLSDLPKFEKEFFETELDDDDRAEFKRILKSDLRQNYYHAIETFFELFFALNPKNKKNKGDEQILFTLTYSDWKETYEKIKEIAENSKALDFLDEKITLQEYNITIGHYLFYFGIYSKEDFPPEAFENLNDSIDAIKHGIRIIANDFIKREEYNAYKHGLRIIPSMKKFILGDIDNLSNKIEWDLSDSMSFCVKTKSPIELKIVTKLYDSERDFKMTCFCSNLIHHLLFLRRISMKFEKDQEKFSKFSVSIFGKKEITECSKQNVSINNLTLTVTKHVEAQVKHTHKSNKGRKGRN